MGKQAEIISIKIFKDILKFCKDMRARRLRPCSTYFLKILHLIYSEINLSLRDELIFQLCKQTFNNSNEYYFCRYFIIENPYEEFGNYLVY